MALVAHVKHLILLMILAGIVAAPGTAAAQKNGSARTELTEYVAELQKSPRNKALREKIIKTALGMKPSPTIPENAERHMARGVAFFNRASDVAGFRKAVREFDAAAKSAPWLDKAYYNLGVAQEKAGMYKDAIDNLKLYLLANPKAKNQREVKNQIYTLEVNLEEAAAVTEEPHAADAPEAPDPDPDPDPDTTTAVAPLGGAAELDIEPEKPLVVAKLAKVVREKKANTPSFAGNWFYKDVRGGEEISIQAFQITQDEKGAWGVIPPKRLADNVATVQLFEVNENNLKLEFKWKMKSVVGYWKIETYDLTLSEDGKLLAGSYNQESVGGRKVFLDKELFRQ